MEKEQLLQQIKEMAASGHISGDEISDAYDAGLKLQSRITPGLSLGRRVSIADILYYFGAVVVFVGVVILVGQNWDLLNDSARIASTLGIGVVLLASGLLLDSKKLLPGAAQSFIVGGSLVFPVGIFVLLKILQFDTDDLGLQSLYAFIIAGFFILSYWQFKKLMLLIFSIGWVTGFYFVFTSFLLDALSRTTDTLLEYRFVAIGLAYIGVGYLLGERKVVNNFVRQVLYALGIIAFLGGGFALADSNHIFEALYPLFALGAMFASVSMRSRAFLVLGGLSLVSYIFYITGKYFSGSVGWPVALIISGFALVGIGYVIVMVNKKYFSKSQTEPLEITNT